jgi:vacuole morphology and inheritance protein 14
LSLCLLAQSYELAARIVGRLGELTVTVGLLMQVDKLVQLLESPIFLPTRMHLLQPERGDASALLRALYGLLMLLPQGTAFSTLRERLNAVTSLHVSLGNRGGGASGASGAGADAATGAAGSGHIPFDLDEAFAVFADRQRQAREALTAELRSRSLLHGGGVVALAASGVGGGGWMGATQGAGASVAAAGGGAGAAGGGSSASLRLEEMDALVVSGSSAGARATAGGGAAAAAAAIVGEGGLLGEGGGRGSRSGSTGSDGQGE